MNNLKLLFRNASICSYSTFRMDNHQSQRGCETTEHTMPGNESQTSIDRLLSADSFGMIQPPTSTPTITFNSSNMISNPQQQEPLTSAQEKEEKQRRLNDQHHRLIVDQQRLYEQQGGLNSERRRLRFLRRRLHREQQELDPMPQNDRRQLNHRQDDQTVYYRFCPVRNRDVPIRENPFERFLYELEQTEYELTFDQLLDGYNWEQMNTEERREDWEQRHILEMEEQLVVREQQTSLPQLEQFTNIRAHELLDDERQQTIEINNMVTSQNTEEEEHKLRQLIDFEQWDSVTFLLQQTT
jgi:hypothetical protein